MKGKVFVMLCVLGIILCIGLSILSGFLGYVLATSKQVQAGISIGAITFLVLCMFFYEELEKLYKRVEPN
jgi:Na+/melibiose symporter-like transporter